MQVAQPSHPVAPTSPPLLDHERLDAYRVAVALDEAVVGLTRRAPRGHSWLCDQAQRACGSAVLNLAEAVGREGADRARMLRIARGSALELDAALTLLAHRGACAATTRGEARALTVRLVAMLVRLGARAGG
jgi:four helix bundle protein